MAFLESTLQREMALQIPPPGTFMPGGCFTRASLEEHNAMPPELHRELASLFFRAYDAYYNKIQQARDPMLTNRTYGEWMDTRADLHAFIGANDLWRRYPSITNCLVDALNNYGYGIAKPAIW